MTIPYIGCNPDYYRELELDQYLRQDEEKQEDDNE